MNTSQLSKVISISIPALVIALTISLLTLWLSSSWAQETAFNRRFPVRTASAQAGNIKGNIVVIGNTVLHNKPNNPDCCANSGNNDAPQEYVEIDPGKGRFNSSRANLQLPTGAAIRWAGLYWGATLHKPPAGLKQKGAAAAPNPSKRDQVLLRYPGSSGYEAINGSLIGPTNDGTKSYQSFADVTTYLKNSGSGAYTVANVQAATGYQRHGGWSLVIVYENPSDPMRNLAVFDGYKPVLNGGETIPLNDFLTALAGGPTAKQMWTVAYEGDRIIKEDRLRVNGQDLPPGNNYFQSLITDLAAPEPATTQHKPNFENTFGLDIRRNDISTSLPNGATSASLRLATDEDGVTLGVVALASQLSPPTITGATLSRQQGSPASNYQIAGVSDADQSPNTLSVTVNGGAIATVNGVTVSGLAVNALGQVTANVIAACNAAAANFTLRVTDSQGLFAEAKLNVTVNPNTPPVLAYNNQTVPAGGSVTINPSAGPSDNGVIALIAIQGKGAFLGGISVAPNGVISIQNATPAGSHIITIRATDNCGAITDTSFTLTVTCPTIIISPPSLTPGTASAAYPPVTFTQTGGIAPIAWSFSGTLPSGMIFISSTATLSGTPTQAGTFTFKVQAKDANNCIAERTYSLVINCSTVVHPLVTLPEGTAGVVYPLVMLGHDLLEARWSLVGALPIGMSSGLTPAEIIVLGGTPTETGTFNFKLQAKDSNNCIEEKPFKLVINCPVITVTPPVVNRVNINASFSQSFTQTGGVGAVTFTTTDPLPPGVTLAPNGTLSGTPTQGGTFSITIKATDANNCMGTIAVPYILEVNTPPTITPRTVTRQRAKTLSVSEAIATASDDFTTVDGLAVSIVSTPAGITADRIFKSAPNILARVNASCAAALGNNEVEIKLTDSGGLSTTGKFIVNVIDPPAPTLGNYPSPGSIVRGTGVMITPDAAPTLYASVTAEAPGFTGTLSVNTSTGALKVVNAGPAGTHTITVKANDVCGTATTKTISLVVTEPPNFACPYPFSLNGKTLPPNSNGHSIAIADFNGDGKKDLALAGSKIKVLFNDGAGNFTDGGEYLVGTYPWDIVSGDFNGDNKIDLAGVFPFSGVTVLLNSGNGQFGAATNYAVGSFPNSLASRDFNGDGKLDLVTANEGSADVSVLLNNGSGGFSQAVNYVMDSSPQSVAANDFNGDGNADIAVVTGGNATSDSLFLLLGNGAGNFSAPIKYKGITIDVSYLAYSITSGDFNNDGKADLVVPGVGDQLAFVLLGESMGFSPINYLYSTNQDDGPSTAGDFNGDGKADFAVAKVNAPGIRLFLGNGNGTFSPAPDLATGGYGDALAAGDLNGDGRDDLVLGSGVVYLSNCSPPSIIPVTGLAATQGSPSQTVKIADVSDAETPAGQLKVVASSTPAGLTITDIANNNGVVTAKIAAACNAVVGENTIVLTVDDSAGGMTTANLKIIVIVNPGPTIGNYPSPPAIPVGGSVTVTPDAPPNDNGSIKEIKASPLGTVDPVTGAVTIGNAQPAGLYNIIVTVTDNCDAVTTRSFQLTVTSAPAPCNGTPSFSAAVKYPTVFSGGSAPESVVVSDFNKDNKPDMAVANHDPDLVSILIGDGNGDFSLTNTYSTGIDPVGIAVGDFNLDGNIDLVVTNAGSDNISILLGDGTGGFSAPTNFAVGALPIFVVVGKFNQDNKPDLAVANYNSHKVSVLLGNGVGGFSAAAEYAVGTGPDWIAVGDFDLDGDTDLAVTNDFSANVSVLLGNGAGGFGAANNLAVGNHPYSVSAADFNLDAKLDLAVTLGGDGNVRVMAGDGNGGFSLLTTTPVSPHPYGLTVGDFNLDGKPDLAVTNYDPSSVAETPADTNSIAVMLGDGAGNFTGLRMFAVGSKPRTVTTADFNRDGMLDLATADFGYPGTMSVLLSNCPAPPPPACVLPPSGLVSWWRAEGNGFDSVSNNHGAVEGSVTFASGKVGQAFKFNGNQSDGINLGNVADFDFSPNSSFTLEVWVNPAVIQGQSIFSLNYKCSLTTEGIGMSGGVLGFGLRDGNGGVLPIPPLSSPVTVNTWYHVVGVREVTASGKTVRLYINGVLVASTPDPTTGPLANDGPDYIGRAYPCPNNIPFNGLIDEVAVYNRALTDSEVLALYNAGGAGKCLLAPR